MEKQRTDEIIQKLLSKTPNPKIELNYSNAFELLIATILAAQCTDVRVNIVTKTFFKEYPTPAKIADEDPEVIAEKIKSTGFYRNKAKSIIACCQIIIKEHQGVVPETVEELTKLPGVGRKTANVVIGNVFGKQAIAVDTHLKRVAERLGLTDAKSPDEVEQDLIRIIDQDKWTLFTQLVILHGRYTCKSLRPRCNQCVISQNCSWDGKTV
jgi:endonuclease-3